MKIFPLHRILSLALLTFASACADSDPGAQTLGSLDAGSVDAGSVDADSGQSPSGSSQIGDAAPIDALDSGTANTGASDGATSAPADAGTSDAGSELELGCEDGDLFSLVSEAEGGRIDLNPTPGPYPCGEVVELTATAEPSMRFVGWSGALEGDANPTTLVVTADVSVRALFEPTITAEITEATTEVNGNAVTISWRTSEPTTGEVHYGLDASAERLQVDSSQLALEHLVVIEELTYNADYAYQIVALDADGSTSDPFEGTFRTEAEPDTCSPEEPSLTVTLDGPGSVAVDPDRAVYTCGESVTLTAQPDPEAIFLGWSGSLTSTDNPLTVTLLEELSLVAAFAPDTTPPVISDIAVSTSGETATIRWSTDEPATGSVSYGTTNAHELGAVEAGSSATNQQVTLVSLTPGVTYHYQISATDEAGNATSTTNATFVVGAGPSIDVWYGDSQSFGLPGDTQRWVNVMGSVSPAEEIAQLSYTLNGGASQNLGVGPDGRRLSDPGDFNIEIDLDNSELMSGTNTLIIAAEDTGGAISQRVVSLQYTGGSDWPLPFVTNWDGSDALSDAAQVVDGLWTVSGGQVRTDRTRYDRTLAIGDRDWTDYEVTVPVTIHGIGADSLGRPAVGVMLRWPGHIPNGSQPGFEYRPQGGGAWYEIFDTNGRLEIRDFEDGKGFLAREDGLTVPFDTPYMFKVRVESLGATTTRYFAKVWPQGDAEPADWTLTADDPNDVPAGSLLLVAHFVDVSFGSVTLNPL